MLPAPVDPRVHSRASRQFRKGWICGKSSEEEERRFYSKEREKISKARDELLAWHEKYRVQPSEKRIEAAVAAWDQVLKDPGKIILRGIGLEKWTNFLAPLIRVGPPAVPFVLERMGKAETLTEEGEYGIAIATMTGKADPGLVRRLLLGDGEQKGLACYIIASAGSKEWKDELQSLLFQLDVEVAWEASDALAACHRKAALPILRAALKQGKFTNDQHVAELAQGLDHASE